MPTGILIFLLYCLQNINIILFYLLAAQIKIIGDVVYVKFQCIGSCFFDILQQNLPRPHDGLH